MEAHLLVVHRLFQPLHFFQPLLAALRQLDRLFAVVHAVAANDGLLPLDLRLLHVVFLQLPLEVGLALHGELIVVAGVLGQMRLPKLGHVVAHGVQEIAVVRNHHHGALVLAQRVLQPLGAAQIQVVGGLVQHQQIRLHQQDARQTQPRLFAAGEQARLLLPPLLREAETGQHALHAAGPLIAARVLKARGQAGVGVAQALHFLRVGVLFGHFRFQLAQTGFHALHVVKHARKLLRHGQVALDVGVLGQKAHRRALHQRHRALVRLQTAGDDLEHRALSAAVHAHDAHARVLRQRETDVRQHAVHDKGFGNIGKR